MNGAWGFCRFCAFQVPVDLEDGELLLVAHERYVDGVTSDRRECPGSGRVSTEQPGPEAFPIKLTKLTKSWQVLAQKGRDREELLRLRAQALRENGVQGAAQVVQNPVEALRQAMEEVDDNCPD